MRKRSARDEFLSPSGGFAGFMHRLVMFILLPLRKPLIVLPILFLLYLVPTFIGAKPTEVHLWYMKEFRKIYHSASAFVGEKAQLLFPKTEEEKMPQMGGRILPEKGIDKLVEPRQKAIRRQMFGKAKSAPTAVNILEVHNTEVVNVEDVRKADREAQSVIESYNQQINLMHAAETPDNATSRTFKAVKKLPLIYLKEPEKVEGPVEVRNANELVVNGTYIFLYGIYSDPSTSRGIDAKKFLERRLKDQHVQCNIVAYTYQNVATALCYAGGENINQLLVDEDLSRNVAL